MTVGEGCAKWLQGQPVNNIVVTARECTRAIAEERLSHTSATGAWRLLTQALVTVEVMRVGGMMTAGQISQMVGLLP